MIQRRYRGERRTVMTSRRSFVGMGLAGMMMPGIAVARENAGTGRKTKGEADS